MKQKKSTAYISYFSGVVFLLLAWIVISSIVNSQVKVPSVNVVMMAFNDLITKKSTYLMIFGTFSRSFIGFSISLVVAIGLGALSNLFKPVKYFLTPLVSSLRAIPTASLILFLLIVIGFRKTPYYLVFIMCFPILYQSIIYGMENIDKELLMINKLDNYDKVKNFFYFILPLSLPSIISGMLTSFALAVKTEIMGEILSGSTSLKGLGILLNRYKNDLETANLFALTLIIIVITISIELLSKLIKKYLKKFEI